MLTEQLQKVTRELKRIDNAEQTLKELEEREKKTKQEEEQLQKQIVTQDKKDKELAEREAAIVDIEDAIKKKVEESRADEQEVYQKLLRDAETYKQEQNALLEHRKATYEEEKRMCRETLEKTLKAEYKAFKCGLEGYVVMMTVVLLVVLIFSLLSHPTFINDTIDFLQGIPKVLTKSSDFICGLIPFKHVVLQKSIAVAIVFATIVLGGVLYVGVRENMGIWYWSVLSLLIVIVVFMGDEVKTILNGANLFGVWLGIVVGIAVIWNLFIKVREMKNGITQDRDKNLIFFVGVTVYGMFSFNMFLL